MSTTTIYKIGNEAAEVGEFRNAHRGAMYVWHQIAKEHFGLDMFPMFDEEMQRKVWNAHDHADLTDDEIIVLASTMDKAVVNHKGLKQLIEAFEVYGKVHNASSLLEQAEVLKAIELSDGEYIAWQQTSCGEFWAEGEWDEEHEEYDFYNPSEGEEHFDVIEQFTEFKANN